MTYVASWTSILTRRTIFSRITLNTMHSKARDSPMGRTSARSLTLINSRANIYIFIFLTLLMMNFLLVIRLV